MKRLRWAFGLLAAALFVLVSLLVERAWEHTQLQRLVRHEAVARRVFDEMERQLTELLRVEEERPYDHYRYFYQPEGSLPGGGLLRSPLAGMPEQPFIIGYFQIDPDGSLYSPLLPRGEERDRLEPGWHPSPEVDQAFQRLQEIIPGHLGAARPGLAMADPPPSPQPPPRAKSAKKAPPLAEGKQAQMPGTTQALQASAIPGGDVQGAWEALDNPSNTINLLNSLNRGSDYRQTRSQKIAKSSASKTRAFTQEDAAPQAYDQGYAQAPLPAQAFEPGPEGDGRRGEPSTRGPSPGGAPGATPQGRSPQRPPLQGPPLGEDTVDVELDPMVARPLGEDLLVLYRTVVVAQRPYRQGLLVGVPALMTWLSDHTLRDGDGADLGRFAGGAWDDLEGDGLIGGFVFRHRFAEPFGSLGGVLELSPLPAEGEDLYIYALSALLLLLGTVGLVVVYRVVALEVSFAERRNDFVSAVTHELKTPLTAIRMYAEMLKEGMVPNDEKRQQYYDTITAEAERLSRLIGNVLELGRIERGARSASLVCGDLKPVLEQVRAVLGPHAAQQGFTIEVEVEDGLPPVIFDRDALLQVLFNLVDNALKYARSADVKRITLACRAEGDGVALAIRDRGPGVPPQHLRKVFEPFYRGERELTRTTKGTGIGLALVKGLAERMGATVSGRNATGGGFEVTLHLAPQGHLA